MEVSSKGITKQLPCNNQTIQAIRKYIQNYTETEMFRRLSDYGLFPAGFYLSIFQLYWS